MSKPLQSLLRCGIASRSMSSFWTLKVAMVNRVALFSWEQVYLQKTCGKWWWVVPRRWVEEAKFSRMLRFSRRPILQKTVPSLTFLLTGCIQIFHQTALPIYSCPYFPPDTPQRKWHSLSLLSGGRLVVCGGSGPAVGDDSSCISWVVGNTSWTHLFTFGWDENTTSRGHTY